MKMAGNESDGFDQKIECWAIGIRSLGASVPTHRTDGKERTEASGAKEKWFSLREDSELRSRRSAISNSSRSHQFFNRIFIEPAENIPARTANT
jgi:hypothetical protein